MPWGGTRPPSTVFYGVILQWVTLAITLVNMIAHAPEIANSAKPASSPGFSDPGIHLVVDLGISVALLLFLIWQTSAGKSWARFFLGFLFVGGLPVLLRAAEPLTVFQTIVQFFSIVLLFLPASNEWFREMRAIRSAGRVR